MNVSHRLSRGERIGGSYEVGEGIHFVGPEKGGAAYRFGVRRLRNEQLALFPEFE